MNSINRLCFHPDPDSNNGGSSKGDPRGPAAGAGMMGGVTGVSGAGRGDERTGGTTGIETEKAASAEEGVASGGSLAGAMNDAGVRATNDPDREQQQQQGEVRQDVMPEISQAEGGTPNPT